MISLPTWNRLWLCCSALAPALALLAAGPGSAGELPEGALPDAVVAGPKHNFKRAWLARPTTRYGHAILGDGIEAGSLVVETTCGHRVEHLLDEGHVFEDRHVRIADLDGDLYAEAIVVLSSVDQGAALAVYSLNGSTCSAASDLTLKARTPFIGTRNRWLNPAGIADYDGDGKLEVAIVVTPHIGGTLQFWSLDGDKMVLKAKRYGYSNHAIGARAQGLSATFKRGSDLLLVLPGADRRSLHQVQLKAGKILSSKIADVKTGIRENFSIRPVNDASSVVTLADGTKLNVQTK
ncbi:MAG: VCBS repeat-containing protein [Pseudomonadota bacterium]